jgi:four helix bundle protein
MQKSNQKYDLEDRTFEFAYSVRKLIRELPKNISIIEDCKQLNKSSGSVAANYIEANEAISRKDFIHRIKICRKEAKESLLWLRLLYIKDADLSDKRDKLVEEARQLTLIFSSIMRKTQKLKN